MPSPYKSPHGKLIIGSKSSDAILQHKILPGIFIAHIRQATIFTMLLAQCEAALPVPPDSLGHHSLYAHSVQELSPCCTPLPKTCSHKPFWELGPFQIFRIKCRLRREHLLNTRLKVHLCYTPSQLPLSFLGHIQLLVFAHFLIIKLHALCVPIPYATSIL